MLLLSKRINETKRNSRKERQLNMSKKVIVQMWEKQNKGWFWINREI